MSSSKSQRDLLKQAIEQRKRADQKRKKREQRARIAHEVANSQPKKAKLPPVQQPIPVKREGKEKTRAGRSTRSTTKQHQMVPFDQHLPVASEPNIEEKMQLSHAVKEQHDFEEEVRRSLEKTNKQINPTPQSPLHTSINISDNIVGEFRQYFDTVRCGLDRIVLKDPKGNLDGLNIRKVAMRILHKDGIEVKSIRSLKQTELQRNEEGYRIYVR